jgi:hypothetical protein
MNCAAKKKKVDEKTISETEHKLIPNKATEKMKLLT